ELADVIDRLVHWTTEEWQQCDIERNARQLTINDQYEIIGMVVVKSTQLQGAARPRDSRSDPPRLLKQPEDCGLLD
ncbi:MAG TPA: hypothetical protein VJQ25_14440, partial [Nitrospira sp.]|nr:hypothetical protein [Nitrospira sp.]